MFNQLKKNLVKIFGISSVEANGIVLLYLILAAFIFSSVVWSRFKHMEYETYSEDKKLLDSLLYLMNADSGNEINTPVIKTIERKADLFKFDPNTVGPDDFNNMGIPSWISARIIKFREAGGRFRVKKDLMKIYGMPAGFYKKIEPYILLPDSIPYPDRHEQSSFPKENRGTEKISINLNIADSLQLIKIKGIGPVLAERIVRYRDLLGGFISIDQLSEVYGLKEPQLSAVKEMLYVERTFIPKKIRINFADWKELVHHPYFDKYLANSIIATRDKSGPFQSTEDLRNIKSLNDSAISKISPYITF